MVTPQTSVERIRQIDQLSDAFIYVVSTAATTGKQSGFNTDTIAYFQKIKDLNLTNPTLIGFGISDNQTYQTACQYANGAIIGSAFIRMLANNDHPNNIQEFVAKIKLS